MLIRFGQYPNQISSVEEIVTKNLSTPMKNSWVTLPPDILVKKPINLLILSGY